ncbi:Ig-like domain-containing protein [Leucobacter luti]|uniref:Ig-like domain-containing protein n=1 Tax=Leucobacter luti TaxID=340320 RepID=A0A4Q7U368_9MICO|nr:Ig-like domain-containing protein [Leucobacter luti]MBL3699528.1 hypothetical protein [Leucobacter luti]RZT67040.1 hypothetical protein EV139_1172 [Leucobacter luti]
MGSSTLTPRSTAPRPALRRIVAVSLGAALAAGSFTLALESATPATAAPTPTERVAAGLPLVFTESRGTDWTVPAGVDEVLVGLRGGKGGDARVTLAGGATGGAGEELLVSVPVVPGDVLTLYAGRASILSREGFVTGALGGEDHPTNILSAYGGSGGGAAAVKLNSQLVAVAAGGGGAGGGCTLVGGNGGTKAQEPQNGGGGSSFGGAAGRNGSETSGWGHAATEGQGLMERRTAHEARKPIGCGPGGGGGGGWPASGVGGSKGGVMMTPAGLGGGGGGGGGAGLGMVVAPATEIRRDQLPTTASFNPFAGPNEVKVTVPLTTAVKARALSEESEMGEPLTLVIQTRLKGVLYSQPPASHAMGEVRVKSGEEVVFSQSVAQRSSVIRATIPAPLTPGNYEYEVEYLPPYSDDNPLQEQGASRTNINNPWVERRSAPPAPELLTDATEATTEDAPPADEAPVTEAPVTEAPVAEESSPAPTEAAGTDPGAGDAADEPSDAAAAEQSAVVPVTYLAEAPVTDNADDVVISPTSTTIASAPSEVRAHHPFTVTAQVVTPQADPDLAPLTPTGEATLTADGLIIGSAVLDRFGRAAFSGVVAPWGTTKLAVHYEGDFNMTTFTGFERSDSDPAEITMTEARTVTELEFSDDDLLAGEETVVRARVTGADLDGVPGPDVLEDPRGQIELLADGEPIGQISVAFDADPEAGDAEAVYTLGMDNLPPGAHSVTARFLPADGFAGSESAPVQLRVAPWDTTLTATPDAVTPKPGTPVTISLTAAAVAPDEHADTTVEPPVVEGYVQAFVAGVPLGDPAMITGGAGEMTLADIPADAAELDLRFTPSMMALSGSSASVRIELADETTTPAAPGGGAAQPGGTAKPGGTASEPLARTGAENSVHPLLGVGVLLVAAGAVLVLGRARTGRRTAR